MLRFQPGVSFTGRIIDLRKKTPLRLKENILESSYFTELWERISPQTLYNLKFSTDAVVAGAVKRIDEMPALEPIKFRLSRDVIDMETEGLSGVGAQDRGEVLPRAPARFLTSSASYAGAYPFRGPRSFALSTNASASVTSR